MQMMMEYLRTMLGLMPRMSLTGLIEIAIISWMVYEFLNWIKDTKAWVLLRGLLLILAFVVFCVILQLDTILWILGRVATIAVMALVIIFQPELRRALEQLGSRNIWFSLTDLITDKADLSRFSEHTVSELVKDRHTRCLCRFSVIRKLLCFACSPENVCIAVVPRIPMLSAYALQQGLHLLLPLHRHRKRKEARLFFHQLRPSL